MSRLRPRNIPASVRQRLLNLAKERALGENSEKRCSRWLRYPPYPRLAKRLSIP